MKAILLFSLFFLIGCNVVEGNGDAASEEITLVVEDYINIGESASATSECINGDKIGIELQRVEGEIRGYLWKVIYPNDDCEENEEDFISTFVPIEGGTPYVLTQEIFQVYILELGTTEYGRLFQVSGFQSFKSDGDYFKEQMVLTQKIDNDTGLFVGDPYFLININDQEFKLILEDE